MKTEKNSAKAAQMKVSFLFNTHTHKSSAAEINQFPRGAESHPFF